MDSFEIVREVTAAELETLQPLCAVCDHIESLHHVGTSSHEFTTKPASHDANCQCHSCYNASSGRPKSAVVAHQAGQIWQLRELLTKTMCDCVTARTGRHGSKTITLLAGHEPACKYRLVPEAMGHV